MMIGTMRTGSVESLQKTLLAAYHYHDAGQRFLKNQALAEVIVKSLFNAPNKRLSAAALRDEVATTVELPNLDVSHLEESIKVLERQGVVGKRQGQWELRASEVARLQTALEQSTQQTTALIEKYFPLPIGQKVLHQWFLTASVRFFSAYDAALAELIIKNDPAKVSGSQLLTIALTSASAELKLTEHAPQLEECFRALIADYKNPLVYGQIWAFAQAMLAAKIVNASVGADPLVIERFKNAQFLLDTNVLFEIAAEIDPEGKMFVGLLRALRHLGATLHVMPHTLEEYRRAVAHQEVQVLRIYDNLGSEIFKHSSHQLLESISVRGCTERPHFVTFFEQMQQMPYQDPFKKEVVVEQRTDVIEAANKGKFDDALKENVGNAWVGLYPQSTKGSNAVEHDAALAAACNHLRKTEEKTWVITTDRSMYTLANKWAGKTGVPAWISLETLLQLIAFADVGPDHNPEDYAALFAALVKADIQPRSSSFKPEDLGDMLDNEERIQQLPVEEIAQHAAAFARARVSGEPMDSAVSDLRRVMQRKLRSVDEVTKDIREQALSSEKYGDAAKEALVNVLVVRYRWLYRARIVGTNLLGIIFAAAIFYYTIQIATQHPVRAAFLSVVGLGLFFGPFWPARQQWSTVEARATSKAEREATKKIAAKQ